MSDKESVDAASMHPIVHTPGPWTWKRQFSNGCEVCPSIFGETEWVATVVGAPHIVVKAKTIANARLIAMSPDMIELAKDFVREWEATWVDPEDSSHLWVAIYREAKRIIREVNGGHK